VQLRAIEPGDLDVLQAFFRRVPEGDRTFFNEDVLDPDVVRAFTTPRDGDDRTILLDDAGTIVGWLALFGGVGWSSHVARLVVIVDPDHRGAGIGKRLAREGLVRGLKGGYSKLVVEIVAEEMHAIAMFQAIGFEIEALLRDHVRDRAGTVRDLVVLAHHAEKEWSEMQALGLETEVGAHE
jgi:ribosomal protein S18 acetylase RimI-like enzyme